MNPTTVSTTFDARYFTNNAPCPPIQFHCLQQPAQVCGTKHQQLVIMYLRHPPMQTVRCRKAFWARQVVQLSACVCALPFLAGCLLMRWLPLAVLLQLCLPQQGRKPHPRVHLVNYPPRLLDLLARLLPFVGVLVVVFRLLVDMLLQPAFRRNLRLSSVLCCHFDKVATAKLDRIEYVLA
jgi:hypothetical protein